MTFTLFLRIAANRSSLLTALKLALVVGMVLNLINQGESILDGDFANVHWPKFLLTFCVPFCVSVYSATKAKIRFDPGTRAIADARLRCSRCGDALLEIRLGETIQECPTCNEGTRWSIERTDRS